MRSRLGATLHGVVILLLAWGGLTSARGRTTARLVQDESPVLEPITTENLDRLTRIGALPYPQDVRLNTVAFSQGDGAWIAAGFDGGSVSAWETADLVPLQVGEEGHAGTVTDLAFSPEDRDLLASASWDTSIRLWFLTDSELILDRIFSAGSTYSVEALAFSPSGLNLIAGYGDNRVLSWRTADGRRTGSFNFDPEFKINDLAFAADGRTLTAASSDGSIILWQVNEEATVVIDFRWSRTVSQLARSDLILVPSKLAFHPLVEDSLAIATFEGALLNVDVGSRQVLQQTTVPAELIDISYSPDGTLLVACTADGKLRIFEAETLDRLFEITQRPLSYGCRFSPDGRRIALAAESELIIFGVPVPATATPTPSATMTPTRTAPPTEEPIDTQPAPTESPPAAPTATLSPTPSPTPAGGSTRLVNGLRDVGEFLGAVAPIFALGVLLLYLTTMTIRMRRAGAGWRQVLRASGRFLWKVLTLNLQEAGGVFQEASSKPAEKPSDKDGESPKP